MFLSLSAPVYCLVTGEVGTDDEGLLLTSNATRDEAGTHAGVHPVGDVVSWGCGTLDRNYKAGYKHTLMEARASQCDTRSLSPQSKVLKIKQQPVESYYSG